MAGSNISKVEVSGKEFPIIEFKGERILTFAMIDKMHGRPEGTARKRFSENSERFVEGKHFHYPDTKPRVARLLAMIEEESQDGEWVEAFQHDPQSVLSSYLVTEEYQPCQ